jgi:hypothetical protein
LLFPLRIYPADKPERDRATVVSIDNETRTMTFAGDGRLLRAVDAGVSTS